MTSFNTHHCPRCGLTLLELLAVLVIAAMITAALTIRLSAIGEDAALRQARASWHELDRRARIFVMTGQQSALIELTHDDVTQRTLATLRLSGSDEIISQFAFPPGTRAIVTPESPHSSILYDRTGRSDDYTVQLLREQVASGSWSVHGLTGSIELLGATP